LWESENVRHLFPVGEVNGSHGVYRPGGAALNAGQVGGFRAAEFIANRYRKPSLPIDRAARAAQEAVDYLQEWLARSESAPTSWKAHREEFQDRMSRFGAHIRSLAGIDAATEAAWAQVERIERQGCGCSVRLSERNEALRTRHLCFAHAVYLDAIRFALKSGVGSRGSAIVLDAGGLRVHPKLGPEWAIVPENTEFREKVLHTEVETMGRVKHEWVPRRPIPESDVWFETTWARFRNGEIYSQT
ncbi:MAG: FAD-binding protein, partial [Kiritimatiellae bacterium]|nr:FAD-binding protein [Kiritimatiellia bacterium]